MEKNYKMQQIHFALSIGFMRLKWTWQEKMPSVEDQSKLDTSHKKISHISDQRKKWGDKSR